MLAKTELPSAVDRSLVVRWLRDFALPLLALGVATTVTVLAWRAIEHAEYEQAHAAIGAFAPSAASKWVLVGGLMVSALLCGLIAILAHQKRAMRQQLTRQTQAVHSSEERFRAIVEASPSALVLVDRSATIQLVNAAAEALFGYERAELVGKSIDVLVPDERRALHRVLSSEYTQTRTARGMGGGRGVVAQCRDGRRVAIDVSLSPVGDEQHPMVLATVIDVAQRRRFTEAMEQLSSPDPRVNVFYTIAHAVHTALDVRWTGVGTFIDGTRRVRVLGACADGSAAPMADYDLQGTPGAQSCSRSNPLVYERDVAQLFPADAVLAQLGAQSYRSEGIYDRDGSWIGVLFAIDDKPCIENANERAFLRLAARRAAMELQREDALENLRTSEQRWQFALEGAGDGVWDWNARTNAVYYSPRWKQMIGYAEHEIGANFSEWESRVHPDDLSACREELRRHLSGATPAYEKEFRMRCKDGAYKWILARGKVVEWSGDGQPARVIGTHADLSARKASEAEHGRLQHQLQQAQKLDAIGQLTGGVAHDFNNILASILGYTELMRETLPSDLPPKVHEYLDQMQIAGERARDLVVKLLSYARGVRGTVRVIDPRAPLSEVMTLLQATLPSSIALSLECDELVPPIRIDPVQLHQVMTNLVINARDALQGKGTIRMGLHRAGANRVLCDSCGASIEGSFVTISVHDDGAGIPREVMARIFDPFFTTKEFGKGTGLGLSMVHGIVHELGGHILVDSAVGEGTRFRLLFPPAIAEAADA